MRETNSTPETDSTDAYDLVILGGGSGGYACALRASQLGLTVALVEKDKVGGTCLHRGCIPTKAFLHSAEVADTARSAERFGVRATLDRVDMPAVLSYKDAVVGRLYRGLSGLVSKAGVTVVEGEGRVEAGGESTPLVVVGERRLRGQSLVVATGSYARTLPGLEIAAASVTATLPLVPAGDGDD